MPEFRRTKPGCQCPRGLHEPERSRGVVAAPGMVVDRTADLDGADAGGLLPGVNGGTWGQWPRAPSLPNLGFSACPTPLFRSASPLVGEPSTGEPDAGDPHVRFGGRGCRIQSTLPTPIIAGMDPGRSLSSGRAQRGPGGRDGHGEQRIHACERSARRPIGEVGLTLPARFWPAAGDYVKVLGASGVEVMSIRSTVLAQFVQVAKEQEKKLAPLSDDLPLTESGLELAERSHHRGAT